MKNTSVSGVFEVSAAPDNGVSSFKQTVFIRQDSTPPTPTGGSYADPYPDEEGWEDGIPDGNNALWASNRIFTSDGKPPQQEKWSVPKPMADTSSFRVRYSSVKNPSGNPDEAPSEWTETGSNDTRWIATIAKENGVWGVWVVTQIVGESAEYYMVVAEVASISRTKDGYSPYLFTVSEYHVKGAEKESSNVYYFHIYGIKGGTRTYIGYSTMVKEYAFNASDYYESDYDTFLFELRESSDAGSKLFASTSVSVSRDGKNGEKGPMERVRKWQTDTFYTAGGVGETFGDIVYEENNGIPYECVVSHWSVAGEPPSVLANNSDPTKRYWRAGEKRYMLATDIMLSRLIAASEIDVKNMLVQMLETKGSDATVRIKEGMMEVFGSVNKNEPNIRFGINDEGYAVLQYFDNNGKFLYDLGPHGLGTARIYESKFQVFRRKYLGITESYVISEQAYKDVLYNDGVDVYKFLSGRIENGIQHPDENGLFYKTDDWDSNKKPTGETLDGWYCSVGAKNAITDVAMMWNWEAGVPPDLSPYNEPLELDNAHATYFKRLEHFTGGVLDNTQNVYWSVKIE